MPALLCLGTHLRYRFAILLCWTAMISLPLLGQESSTAPTISTNPAVIDQQWQHASSKYDARRKEILKEVDREADDGPYQSNWRSLDKYQVPEWYKDAKFGIFIHWGVYSVPAFGDEWYPRNMYREGSKEYKHHLATYGPLSKFGYKDFIPMFKAEKFDPQQWVHLFQEAGARYVVPVFEHHDGFAMYDSDLSDWTAAKMGPHRDVGGELAKAVRAAGLHLGASSHRIEHDFFLGEGRKIDSDVNDPRYAAFYGPAEQRIQHNKDTLLEDWTYVSDDYLDDWLARSAEIVEKYHPDLIWFDWWVGQPDVRKHLLKFSSFYYNHMAALGSVGVINYKYDAMEQHSAVLDIERGQLSGIRDAYWQTDTSISNDSWGYIKNDHFKTPEFIVHELIDIVSKNGNLLVNVGPRSDGTLPDEVQSVLLDIGSWLKVNGEAIYGTRPWTSYGEGPTNVIGGAFHDTETTPFTEHDFRFTQKGNSLYAIELAWPSNGETVIKSLGTGKPGSSKINSVSLLGYNGTLQYEQRGDGLHIRVPEKSTGKYAYAFKIGLSGN